MCFIQYGEKEERKMKTKKKINWVLLIASFAIVFAVAGIGSAFTKIGSWYESVKPAITPPNFVFPIAWSALFVMIALSMYFSLSNARKKGKLAWAFGMNLLLNVMWSFIFFTLHNPVLAFYNIILLLLSIVVLIALTRFASKKAAWLLVPYLIWVSFASYLNWLIAFA
jgi:tryptophan-rich sensory protein